VNPSPCFQEPEIQAPKRRAVSCPARVKALDPITSTCPPTHVRVIEYGEKSLTLEASRFFVQGTLLQLNVERNFSLWKVRSCDPAGTAFHIGLELAEILHPFAQEIRLERDSRPAR
jgi:hypothetical protein